MLNSTEIVICPRCDKKSTLKEWDDNTFKECKSREMRRLYLHLNMEKAFKKSSDTFYLCPKCNNWSRGSQLIVDSNDKRLIKLGRQPVFEFVESE